MDKEDFAATLADWTICKIASGVLLAGRIVDDRKGPVRRRAHDPDFAKREPGRQDR
jgi:hypothetical protein